MLILFTRSANSEKVKGCVTRPVGSAHAFVPMPHCPWAFKQEPWVPKWILYDSVAASVVFFECTVNHFSFVWQNDDEKFDIWINRNVLYWSVNSHDAFPLATKKIIVVIYMSLKRCGMPSQLVSRCVSLMDFACLRHAISTTELQRQQCQKYGCEKQSCWE
jgi:hypothetical protein